MNYTEYRRKNVQNDVELFNTPIFVTGKERFWLSEGKQEKCGYKSTSVKLLKKIEFDVCDNKLSGDERHISLSMYECVSCHWQFYADIVRFGYGFNSEYQQKPNFCPGCGRKIDD